MKSVFFILIIFLLACSSISTHREIDDPQQKSENKILWSSKKKLKWSDFKGTPRKDKGTIRAETYGEIATVKSYWKEGIPKFDIRCYFLKNKSWTIVDDIPTLDHEQIHFDIYEIYSRKIRKSFDSLNKKKVIDFSIYEKVFNKFLKKNQDYNDKYDLDVKFDRSKQLLWKNLVSKELEELKEYEYVPSKGNGSN
jgi:hypothetical protein